MTAEELTDVPVLLLIQISCSTHTEDWFPTATVNGICHCKLQRESCVSDARRTGAHFIASVSLERDIRKSDGHRPRLAIRQRAELLQSD